jgi:tRNA threonylcarbamoyladenosine biosynthesis protein TsaE
MEKEVIVDSIEALDAHLKDWFLQSEGENQWLFFGEMGAGKTTLISKFCKFFGVDDEPSSPTFSIVNEYLAKDGRPIYHFDFYRINSVEEALDMGVEHYIYSQGLCLMEWPQKVEPILKPNYFSFSISDLGQGRRLIKTKLVK